MAKDPAFLFYDGDAARDVSHLNRLERGCYFDILQAQRKFGRMSVDLIKKVLGKDFNDCWEQVKICLTYEEDMFFIAWLEDSTNKRKAYSESRSKNRNSSKSTTYNPTYVPHMENENENTNESKVLNEKLLIPKMFSVFQINLPKYPAFVQKDFQPLKTIADFIHTQTGLNGNILTNQKVIIEEWEKLCVVIASDNFYSTKTLSTISNQIQEIYQITKNGRTNKQSTGSTKFNAGANELLDRIKGQVTPTGKQNT